VHHESTHQLHELPEKTRLSRRWSRGVLERVGWSFHPQERHCVSEFDVTWPHDSAEGQHLERFSFLSLAVEVCLKVVNHHLVDSMIFSEVAQIRMLEI
jgi:hypothetical protein